MMRWLRLLVAPAFAQSRNPAISGGETPRAISETADRRAEGKIALGREPLLVASG